MASSRGDKEGEAGAACPPGERLRERRSRVRMAELRAGTHGCAYLRRHRRAPRLRSLNRQLGKKRMRCDGILPVRHDSAAARRAGGAA